jgi:hypothetical protein
VGSSPTPSALTSQDRDRGAGWRRDLVPCGHVVATNFELSRRFGLPCPQWEHARTDSAPSIERASSGRHARLI